MRPGKREKTKDVEFLAAGDRENAVRIGPFYRFQVSGASTPPVAIWNGRHNFISVDNRLIGILTTYHLDVVIP